MGLHNIILNVDNYKHCHYPLYPSGTEYVSSYIESRGGEFECTMFVGLQAFLREYLMHPITLEDIDEEAVREKLYTAPWSDPDLLIRTSGELRISNFLLWQLAYTELYMTPVLWPDVTRRDLFQAILDYQRRDRRFGKVTAPAPP